MFEFARLKDDFLDRISLCTIEIPEGANRSPGFTIEVDNPDDLGFLFFSWVFQDIGVGRFEPLRILSY